MSLVLVYIGKALPWLIINIFLRRRSEEPYQGSSVSEVKVAEVVEETAIMVELDNEISFLSDFPDDPVALQAEEFNNKEILTDGKIE